MTCMEARARYKHVQRALLRLPVLWEVISFRGQDGIFVAEQIIKTAWACRCSHSEACQ